MMSGKARAITAPGGRGRVVAQRFDPVRRSPGGRRHDVLERLPRSLRKRLVR